MLLNLFKNGFSIFFFFIVSGCGIDLNPTTGHDPNKPIPVIIADAMEVMVDHTRGAIIKTPDGMAMLSISQSALSADTAFGIKIYPVTPKGGPIFYAGLTNLPNTDPPGPDKALYLFSPAFVPNLNPGAKLTITLAYDPGPFPVYEPRITNSPDQPDVFEMDLQVGLFQDNVDYTLRCWKKVFFDSPPIVAGQSTHTITTRETTELGVFGITSKYSYVCPYNFIYRPLSQ